MGCGWTDRERQRAEGRGQKALIYMPFAKTDTTRANLFGEKIERFMPRLLATSAFSLLN
jgi:hypothetical protein